MIRNSYSLIIFFVLISTLSSCWNEETPQGRRKFDPKEVTNGLVEVHKRNIKIEDQQIDDYLARRNWVFIRTNSGLRYKIYEEGIGLRPESGQRVVMEYSINLIRGKVVYDSKKDGLKTFIVGSGDEPTGLQEAVKLMKVGSRAKLILPSYLAYGFIGDEKSIPPNATLFYDLYLREVH